MLKIHTNGQYFAVQSLIDMFSKFNLDTDKLWSLETAIDTVFLNQEETCCDCGEQFINCNCCIECGEDLDSCECDDEE